MEPPPLHRTLPTSKALALVVGALALVVTSFAGTAGATSPDGAGQPARDGTIHQTLPIAADSFQQEDDCGSITEGTAWHFILTGAASPAGSTLTATFEDAGTTSVAVARVTGDAAHYYLATADGDVLTAASVDTGDGQLQLSHVCDAPDVDDDEDTTGTVTCPGETEPMTVDTDGDGTVDEDDCVEDDEPVVCEDDEELADHDDDEMTDEVCVAVEDDVNTVIEIECIDDEVVVTVTGQDLSNIFFYDAEDGVRGGQDTVFEYSEDGDAPLPTPTVNEDGSEEFVVSIPEGAVRVSAKAALVEEYSDVDCAGEVIGDDVDCPTGMVPPASGELLDSDGNGEAENCTSVLGGEVVTDIPVQNPVTPTEDGTPTPEAPTEVEGDEVVVPATPAVPTVQPAIPAQPTVLDSTPAVMGDVVTRGGQLPRTGSDSAAALVPFGLALLATGFALQRTGRRAAAQLS